MVDENLHTLFIHGSDLIVLQTVSTTFHSSKVDVLFVLQVAGISTIAAVDRFVIVAGTAVLPLALDTCGLYDVG
jgi:hypothetical protein